MISEATIQERASPQSFERGERYFRNGAIFGTVKRGSSIEAQYQGSDYEPYLVKATITGNQISQTSCTCPYDWGGDCKHVVALLLTWLHEPEQFEERAPIVEGLQAKSKDELIDLILLALEHEPRLESLFQLSLPTETASSERPSVDADSFRQRIRHIRQTQDMDWHSLPRVAREISEVNAIGRKFLNGGDTTNAALIFGAVVDEGVLHYPDFYDDDGIISGALAGGIGGLADCLRQIPAEQAEKRMGIVEQLYRLVEWDTDQGGYGMEDEAWAVLMEETTADERAWVREQVEGKLSQMPPPKQPDPQMKPWEHDRVEWQREGYASLLLGILDDDIELYLNTARQYHLYSRLFRRLVEAGRIKEAIEVARSHFAGTQITWLASSLEEAGHGDEALRLVEDAS